MKKCKQCHKTLVKRPKSHKESDVTFAKRVFCDWMCFRKYIFVNSVIGEEMTKYLPSKTFYYDHVVDLKALAYYKSKHYKDSIYVLGYGQSKDC